MRYALTIQYLGTRYAGWQTQSNAVGVQQVIESALSRLCQSAVMVEGASRTDAGVHAAAQCAHTDLAIAIAPRGLVLGLNNLLPPDIRIVGAARVDEDFHARFDAVGKTYVYRIWNASTGNVFLAPTHADVFSPLDENLMHAAAQSLAGEHDFRSFSVPEPEVSSTVRTLHGLSVTRDGNVVTLRVSGNGFLRYMVRRIAGLLIEIGKGKVSPEAAGQALEPVFRESRWTAPPHGLTLEAVHYDWGSRRGDAYP